MAANETVNNDKTNVESIVNRWLVDYYLFRSLDAFKNGRYQDFCGLREVLKSVLLRPVELTDVMPAKIRVLEFLSQINDGEKLDLSIESDSSITPLESALMLLENMNQECSIRQQDFENAHASITEMIVGIFIKNNKFDRAEEILHKHFPKPMVGKKAIFMGLINRKSKIHEVIKQMNFQRFREEMLAFCQGLFRFSVPFLYKAAEQLIDERCVEQNNKAAGTYERTKPGLSSNLQGNVLQYVPRLSSSKCSVIQKVRLEAAYKALGAAIENRTFTQLEEDVEREEQDRENLDLLHPTDPKTGTKPDSEQEGLFQRDSGSPMEASPADQPPQTDAAPETLAGSLSKTPSALWSGQVYTVPRLVVEPDSQVSSQCITDSPEQETDVRAETPPQTLARSNKDLQCPVPDREVDVPVRRCPRRAKRAHCRASTSASELSADSEEGSLNSVANGESRGEEFHSQSNSSRRRNSKKAKELSNSEEDPLEVSASCKTPVQKPHQQLPGDHLSKDSDNGEDFTDSSLDSSPSRSPVPRISSTPHRDSAQNNNPSSSKWKRLFREAQESKETWTDEESHFPSKKSCGSNQNVTSNSGRKKMWTDRETQNLKDGVKKFGEGNWKQIRAYYCFNNRTNVNLKDRWRTMKNKNMI